MAIFGLDVPENEHHLKFNLKLLDQPLPKHLLLSPSQIDRHLGYNPYRTWAGIWAIAAPG